MRRTGPLRALWVPCLAGLLMLACCAGGQKAGTPKGEGGSTHNSIRYAKELAARADPLMIVASALGDWGSSSPAGGGGKGAGSGQRVEKKGRATPAKGGRAGGEDGGANAREAAEKAASLDRAKAAREMTKAASERKKELVERERREREAAALAAKEAKEREARVRREKEDKERREKKEREKEGEKEKERQRREGVERDRARLAAEKADAPPKKKAGMWGRAPPPPPEAPQRVAGAVLEEALRGLSAVVHSAAAPLGPLLSEAAAALPTWCEAARAWVATWCGAARARAAEGVGAVCGSHEWLAQACRVVGGLTGNDWVLLALAGFLAVASYTLLAATQPQIRLIYARTPRNERIVAGCSELLRGFRPTAVLLSGHAQTASVLGREGPRLVYDREMVPTRDGGWVSLDWVSRTSGDTCPHAADPRARGLQSILVVLHGLTGGSHEAYVRGLADCAARRAGMRVVVLNYRGCAGSSLLTPQAYSAAWTADVRCALAHIHARWPAAPLFGVGFSLGANILMKHLGEEGAATPLAAACVVSNPYELAGSNAMMHRGLGPLYDRVLARGLVRTFAAHRAALERRPDLPSWPRVAASATVREFDDRHTRRVFGYASVEDYYFRGSCARVCGGVGVPLLFLVAEDDYLLDVRGMDFEAMARNPNVVVAVTHRGGHVAWHGTADGREQQWAEGAALQFLSSALATQRGLP